MKEHEVIIFNLLVFLCIFILSRWLTGLFFKKSKSLPVREEGTRDSHNQLYAAINAFFIFGLSLFTGSLDVILSKVLNHLQLVESNLHELSVEETYLEAWILFWLAIGVLHLAEFFWRRSYEKRSKPFPIGPLLTAIVRLLLIFATSIWIVYYVLGWNSLHLLVSATALTAIAGFALKGTLVDLLAGVSLHISRSILPEQWVQFPVINLEGRVVRSNWRETRIRTTSGHIYIVPNSYIANNIFHNMSWPDVTRRHALSFVIDASCSPETVEAALLADINQVNGVLQDPKPPHVIVKEFLPYGIRYHLRFWSNTYFDRSAIENGVYRAAWQQLQKHNVKLPLIADSLIKQAVDNPNLA